MGFRLNSAANKLKNRALGIGKAASAGRKRSFNTISEDKLSKMMQLTFQQHTEAKIKWAVRCYNDWRTMRLDQEECDQEIIDADIEDIDKLSKENFEFALCRFVCEVRKVNSDEDYPGRTLYQMVCALQNQLKKKV